MTPLPKRRHSSRRQAKRTRALTRPTVALTTCSQCGALRIPHRVCARCGYYDGRQVLTIKKEKHQKKHTATP